MNIFFYLKTDNFIINCVPLSPTNTLYLKVSPHNLRKYVIKGTSKIPISPLFSKFGKIQKYNELGKNMFSIGKKSNFKPIGNSAHTTEFFTF